ncbi:hypothetical protein [Mycolicibacterium tokaiense]|uniref:Uncharacterized protein n=1 Tax=Mycolicibacterium tokaiense TaxID=39695 RepID=A0A378TGK6_9MYCO|nr:hypothetical protein [Mycolicibacterium tokaiense]BBY85824.1 hypothetical protein MTOK_16060 [Mycolicibacterium tokaiense]STZ59664.1 Uncharacterised protein [Mycolicibacterium tokaiense]
MSGSSVAVAGQKLHRQLAQLLAAPLLASDHDPLDLVRDAAHIRSGAGALMAAAVQQARDAGSTWQGIGQVLGVSRQTVFQKYGKPTDPRNGEVMNTSPLLDAIDLAR